jgi:hypothetical protein
VHEVHFELLDRYLLEGKPAKDVVVKTLLSEPSAASGAAPFYEGMRMLGARTPDLTLVALRLVLAGKKADDESVVELRTLAERARAAGAGGIAERRAYELKLGTE